MRRDQVSGVRGQDRTREAAKRILRRRLCNKGAALAGPQMQRNESRALAPEANCLPSPDPCSELSGAIAVRLLNAAYSEVQP